MRVLAKDNARDESERNARALLPNAEKHVTQNVLQRIEKGHKDQIKDQMEKYSRIDS